MPVYRNIFITTLRANKMEISAALNGQ